MRKQLLSERDLEALYNEILDDAYGLVTIAGLEYATSDALKDVDPTAYRCGFNDWLDSELRDDRIHEIDGEYFDGPADDESEAV